MIKHTNPASLQHTVLIIFDSPKSYNWDNTLAAHYYVS